MAQPKGKTGNPHGRPKGVPNKATSTTREWISKLIDDNREQIEQDLRALEPKERLQMLERFMHYAVPKIQSVELTGKDGKELNKCTTEIVAIYNDQTIRLTAEDIDGRE